MLLYQFFAQNLRFAISLFAALSAFAVFWLIFDAWTMRRQTKELAKWLGFLLLALGFLVYAAVIEQASFGQVPWSHHLAVVSGILRLVGYIAIVIGHLLDPLQAIPQVSGLELDSSGQTDKPKAPTAHSIGLLSGIGIWQITLPVAALTVGGMYWRRAHTGLERHLQPVAVAFMWLAGFELLSLGIWWRTTTNPNLSAWLAPFGIVWVMAHASLLVGAFLLARWVWQYLVKRLQSQLFMIFTTLTMAVFVVTTVSFTYLLMNNVGRSALDNLATANQVLHYALDAKAAATLSAAEELSQNTVVTSAVARHDHTALLAAGGYLGAKGLSSLVITSESGQVLLRAEDPSRWGGSLSGDALVRRALLGAENSSVITRQGVLAPTVAIQGAVPIKDASGAVIGVVVAERAIDNAFVDGIKHSTGLDSAVYAGDVRASTTLVAPDGLSRWVGVTEVSKPVGQQVLRRGQTFSGPLNILNRNYLAVYSPIKDVDNNVVGMLFIGEPEVVLLQTIARSIELTFLVAVVLLVMMIAPAYLIARYLSGQLS